MVSQTVDQKDLIKEILKTLIEIKYKISNLENRLDKVEQSLNSTYDLVDNRTTN